MDEEKRLTRAEAAQFLQERGYHVAISTLAKYAAIGGGPKRETFGRKPLYKPSDLIAWIKSKTTPCQ